MNDREANASERETPTRANLRGGHPSGGPVTPNVVPPPSPTKGGLPWAGIKCIPPVGHRVCVPGQRAQPCGAFGLPKGS